MAWPIGKMAENLNSQGPGGQGEMHMAKPMGMGKNYDIFAFYVMPSRDYTT